MSSLFLRKIRTRYQLGSASSVKPTIEAWVKRGILTNNKAIDSTGWYFSLWLKNQL